MKSRLATGTLCLLSPAVVRAICEIDSNWLGSMTVILIDDVRKPYMLRRRTEVDLQALDFVRMTRNGKAGFSLDPDRGVFQGGSVVVSALQFAAYFKPLRIGLLGIDIANADAPRFYESKGATAASGIAKARDRIVDHLVLAKTICGENSIVLSNHSPVSTLVKCGFGYDGRFEA